MSDVEERLKTLEEMARENHDFWFKNTVGGKPRAERLDAMLALADNSKFTFKLVLWMAGGSMSLVGAWSVVQRLLEGMKP